VNLFSKYAVNIILCIKKYIDVWCGCQVLKMEKKLKKIKVYCPICMCIRSAKKLSLYINNKTKEKFILYKCLCGEHILKIEMA